MSYSVTTTQTDTFTITHARHLASKVATDLKRMQQFYGDPSDKFIEECRDEVAILLKGGYLDYVWYGFERGGNWVEPAFKYTADELVSSSAVDNDPGKIKPGCDITGATFYSFLDYNDAWRALSHEEREKFREKLPFKRGSGTAPGVGGYLVPDLTYSAGGKVLNRFIVKSI